MPDRFPIISRNLIDIDLLHVLMGTAPLVDDLTYATRDFHSGCLYHDYCAQIIESQIANQ